MMASKFSSVFVGANGGAAPEMEFPIHPAFDPFLGTVL